MKKLEIIFDNDKRITNIKADETIVAVDLLNAAMDFLAISCDSVLNQRSKQEGYDEKKSLEDRKAIYELAVGFVNALAYEIYPEMEEEAGSPEQFLQYLDDKIKKLEELKSE